MRVSCAYIYSVYTRRIGKLGCEGSKTRAPVSTCRWEWSARPGPYWRWPLSRRSSLPLTCLTIKLTASSPARNKLSERTRTKKEGKRIAYYVRYARRALNPICELIMMMACRATYRRKMCPFISNICTARRRVVFMYFASAEKTTRSSKEYYRI